MNPGDKALNNYTLHQKLPTGDAVYERWEAFDEFGGPVLVKAWPFGAEHPSQAERALWNVELRNLFRLSSLPSVDQHLVVLRNAGLDSKLKYFILVLHAPGFVAMDGLIQGYDRPEWLTQLSQPSVRADLWYGIRRLVFGLKQIHQLRMVHRAISPLTVLVDASVGPDTFRLDCGDLLMRLGEESIKIHPNNRTRVAGLAELDLTFSFDSDWYQLGTLMALLLQAEGQNQSQIEDVLTRINTSKALIPEEKDLINRLIGKNKRARLTMADDVLLSIDKIITNLGQQRRTAYRDSYLGLVAVLGILRPLTSEICEIDDSIDPDEVESQRRFIQEDLIEPRVARLSGDDTAFILIGRRLCYRIRQYSRQKAVKRNWDLALCETSTELRYSDESQIELAIPIKVFTAMEAQRRFDEVTRGSVAWRPFVFPDPQRTGRVDQKHLQKLHDFFRVTNQLELLMRDAELYNYVIEEQTEEGGVTVLVIKEDNYNSRAPFYATSSEGMFDFLVKELEKSQGELFHLDDDPFLSLGRRVPKSEFWSVANFDEKEKKLTLHRVNVDKLPPAPQKGIIRTFGMFGQMKLIKRRGKAIDKLENHSYLLRALSSPSFTRLDAGADGPLPIPIDSNKIDEAKQSAMRSIWNTRPIFALQGPPGTGKTTLVANLMAQVFKDDPVAQVLVTAQAHAAVDVLREKVEGEFGDAQDRPLMIRLTNKRGENDLTPYCVDSVAQDVLNKAVSALGQLKDRTPLQNRWLEMARKAVLALNRKDGDMFSNDFKELIKRSAGITYCTTTAGDLAELADSTQTFDWSIVEEAGKAHGFDLVLPLLTGHRWLLIGDQKQLDAYRYDDFRRGLSNLDEAFEALQNLPGGAGGEVDRELISRWGKYSEDEKKECEKDWKDWLRFFSKMHEVCSRKGNTGENAMAKMLNQQHRMHPTIAELVSKAYYRSQIRSMTTDDSGRPLPRVLHSFIVPEAIQGKALVWLDVPWIEPSESDHDQKGEYKSETEAQATLDLLNSLRSGSHEKRSLAILSPYRKQVDLLNKKLKTIQLPDWVKPCDKPVDGLNATINAKTVDSFQGDQADVVVVSLVRNNRRQPKDGLGFLVKSERMNVLFSRAERLLILIGSWDFFIYQLQNCQPDPDLPFGSWKIAIDYLQACFDKKLAVKLDLKEILPKEQ